MAPDSRATKSGAGDMGEDKGSARRRRAPRPDCVVDAPPGEAAAYCLRPLVEKGEMWYVSE